jgi:hypothetical protein
MRIKKVCGAQLHMYVHGVQAQQLHAHAEAGV